MVASLAWASLVLADLLFSLINANCSLSFLVVSSTLKFPSPFKSSRSRTA